MRVLIINLTRFGDLLQTQPVVHALREQGHQAGLVCLDNFAEAGALLDGLDALAPLPGSGLLASLDADWRQGAGLLVRWTGLVRQHFPPDRVLNLTSTPGARLLARLLACPGAAPGGRTPVGGFSVDEHGFGSNGSLWGAFFEASTRKRGCSPYNLVDVFRKAAGVGGQPARFALRRPEPETAASLRARLEAGGACRGYVAFQLGASEERRRWPVERFAALGRLVHEELGLMPVLLGAPGERPLAEAYLDSGAPAVDLLGRTSLGELAAALTLVQLLVTNDTGTMHLAAGLGVPSLAFFLATAQAWDTGPYLEDCCCLEPALGCHPCAFGAACPHDEACRERLSADAIWPLLRERLLRGRWPERAPGPTAAVARVWLTTRDEAGFLDLRSLSGHEGEERSVWLRLQRHFYRQFLDVGDGDGVAAVRKPETAGGSAAPIGETQHFLPPGPEVRAAARSLAPERRQALDASLGQVEALLNLLVRQGEVLAMRPTARAGQRFLTTAHRIAGMLETCDAAGAFDALGRLWTAASQERGGDLALVTELAALFQEMARNWRQALAD